MSYVRVNTGDPLPLRLQLSDGDSGKYPAARLRTVGGSDPIGGLLFLTPVIGGLYGNDAYTPPAEGTIFAQYFVYDDAGHTVLNTDYPMVTDTFDVRDESNIVFASPGAPDISIEVSDEELITAPISVDEQIEVIVDDDNEIDLLLTDT